MPDKGKITARIKSNSMEIRVTETNRNGVDYIDVRKFYHDPPDDSSPQEDLKRPEEHFKPTKKGISLTSEQWKKVLKAFDEISLV